MLDWDHAHVTWASDTWLIDSCFCHRVWLICHYGDLPFFYKQCQSYCVLPFLFFFFFFKFHAHCVCACAFCNPLIWACCCRLYSVKLKLNTCKFTPLLLYIHSLWRRKKIQDPSSSMCPSGSRGQTWSIPASSPSASNLSPPPTFFLHSSWLQFGTNNATQEMSFRALWVNHDKLKSDSFTNGVETLFHIQSITCSVSTLS